MQLNSKIEKEIDKFIKYIRKTNSITDDQQLEFFLTVMYNRNPDTYTSLGVDIPGHVQFIREIAKYTDDQLRDKLRKQYNQDLAIQDIFENNSKRQAIREMTDAAKDYKSNPKLFARKVDSEFRR